MSISEKDHREMLEDLVISRLASPSQCPDNEQRIKELTEELDQVSKELKLARSFPGADGIKAIAPAARVLAILLKKCPDQQSLDAIDDDEMSGRRHCPVTYTISDLREARKVMETLSRDELLRVRAAALRTQYNDPYPFYPMSSYSSKSGHPEYSFSDWLKDVENHQTLLGYWEWCAEKEINSGA